MEFTDRFCYTIFILIIVISFFVMVLKKRSLKKIILMELSLATMMVLFATNVFPFEFSSKENRLYYDLFNSFMPFKNINAFKELIDFADPNHMVEFEKEVSNHFIKFFAVDFFVSVVLCALFILLNLKKIKAFIYGFGIVALSILLKMVLFINRMTIWTNFFDTGEIVVAVLGSFLGTVCGVAVYNLLHKKKEVQNG